MTMDWKKFFEPTWTKAGLFTLIYFLTEVVTSGIIAIGTSLEAQANIAMQIIVVAYLWVLVPVKTIVGFFVLEGAITIYSPLYPFFVTLNLIWVYVLASIIDKLVKK